MEVKWDGLLFVASGADEDGIFTLQVSIFELIAFDNFFL